MFMAWPGIQHPVTQAKPGFSAIKCRISALLIAFGAEEKQVFQEEIGGKSGINSHNSRMKGLTMQVICFEIVQNKGVGLDGLTLSLSHSSHTSA